MKKLSLWLLFVWLVATGLMSQVTHVTVCGHVRCNGAGVPNVRVTDGVSVVATDSAGGYILPSTSLSTLVYYSLPSGYESPVVNGLPQFYAPLVPGQPSSTVDFELLQSTRNQTTHSFVVWADPQVLEVADFDKLDVVAADFKTTAEALSASMPVHALALGDLVFDKPDLYARYKQVVKQMGLPFYQVLGNHDMDYNYRSNDLSATTYTANFGPTYYSFNKGMVHYVVLKDVFYYGYTHRYIGYVDEVQLRWLEQDLAAVKPGSTVVVSLHIPTVYGDTEKADDYERLLASAVMNKEALFNILSPYHVHILAGHSHTQWNTVVSPTLMEHTHAAACGAWYQGDVCIDGSPVGYTVYTANGSELTWYFKGVGLTRADQLKVYPVGADKSQPGCVVANVYNFDPSWKVEWYENDVKMGAMQQYWGNDPWAAELFKPGLNKKHAWLSVGPTNHLFKAKVVNKKAKIRVVATDRFGHEYAKEL